MQQQLPKVERTVCPLCKSGDYAVRHSIDNHSIVTCKKCKFEYVIDPIDWSKTQTGSAAKKRMVRPRHQILANYARSCGAKSVLEVGSGVGELGLVLTGQGFSYVGVEPDQQRAISCQEIGLDVRAMSLEELSPNQKADLIVIDNVLEHVLEPIGVLKESQKHLNPDGSIIVVVPNRKDVRQVMPSWRKKNLWVPKVHVNYFTGKSLRRSLTLSGLQAGNLPGSSFRRSNSVTRRMIGLLNSVGVFPFGIYMFGKMPE